MKNRIRLTESQLHQVIKESVKKVLNEISDDTVASARQSAYRRAMKNPNSPRGQKYLRQQKKFSDEYQDRYSKANDVKKNRMNINDSDRQNGKRTYVNGKGWRTENPND